MPRSLPMALLACALAFPSHADTIACEALSGTAIAVQQIRLPTRGAVIERAERASTASGTRFCLVEGRIRPLDYTAPDIHFRVNIPSAWNNKALHFGGGGFNGSLVSADDHYTKQPSRQATPLERGYVTFGSDSGHQSSARFDGSFLLNDEALRNFGHEQLIKTHDAMRAVLSAHVGRAPDYLYFIGGSQGGHEAFDVAQRYGELYNGIVAAYPAHNLLKLHLSANRYAAALMREGGWLSPAHTRLLSDYVYARCDGLDSLNDGVISNVAACREATAHLSEQNQGNPLRCKGGLPAADCLSDAQISTLRLMDSEYDVGFAIYSDDEGTSRFPRWTPFEGSTFNDGHFANLGAEGPEQSLQALPGMATPVYAITRNLDLDPWTDFEPREYAGRIIDLASIYTANSTDLDLFRSRGGKLIMYHGAVDDFIPVYSSIEYYERLRARYGKATASFARFFVVPGMGHISGPFDARIASLDALESWVERGQAPSGLIAEDANEDRAGRTRPLCDYPRWPRYRAGDPDLAESFDCVD